MKAHAFAMFAALGALAACGGGSTISSQQLGGAGSIPTQSVTVTLFVPRSGASARAREPRFVSPNAATLTVTTLTVNGNAPTAAQVPPSVNPTIASLTAGAGGDCTAVTGGLSCTVPVPAPLGSVQYSFQLKDSASNLLATNVATFNVTGGAQTFATQLMGVVRTVTVTAGMLHHGTAFSGPVTVNAFDASGAQIAGYRSVREPVHADRRRRDRTYDAHEQRHHRSVGHDRQPERRRHREL